MSVSDIKSLLYEGFAGGTGISFWDVALMLGISCVVGIYIYIVYRAFSKSEFYSRDLNVTMAGMTIVTAAIMIAMQSNLLVSLGMVGALSIVRFRTAIKSPIDLLYLFWAISAGIICGVGLYVLGITLCVIMTLLIFVLDRVPNARAPQLLVLRLSPQAPLDKVEDAIRECSKSSRRKSLIAKNGEREVIYELRVTEDGDLVQKLTAMPGLVSVNLLEHTGELRV